MFENINALIEKYEFDDYKWIKSETIEVKQWVRFKCMLTCDTYGTNAICPPNMPSIDECKRFFSEYEDVVLIRMEKPAASGERDPELFKQIDENLLQLEKEIFYAGYYKVIALPATICYLCQSCPEERSACYEKSSSRPTPEALGVDLFETAWRANYPVEVLKDYSGIQNRYALIMIN